MVQVYVGMDVYFVFMPVAMDMHKVIRLKKGGVFQYRVRLPGLDYLFIMAKHIDSVRYLLNYMQVMRRGDYSST